MQFVLSMIALAEDRMPTVAEVQQAFATEGSPWGTATNVARNDKPLTFELDGYGVAIGLMPTPIPWKDLQGPIATSPMWPEAQTEMQRQRAHLIVTVFATRIDRIKMWMAMTRAVAALAGLPWVVGIYWPEGGLVHAPATFRTLAAEMSRDRLPLYLWIGFRLGRNPDGTLFGFTTGLAAFEHMELEVSHCDWSPETLVDRLYNFAHYLLDHGPVLLDGQTIGLSAEEQIAIEYRPSMCDDGRQVIHLQP
jgi:hypothetical protein